MADRLRCFDKTLSSLSSRSFPHLVIRDKDLQIPETFVEDLKLKTPPKFKAIYAYFYQRNKPRLTKSQSSMPFLKISPKSLKDFQKLLSMKKIQKKIAPSSIQRKAKTNLD